MEQTPPGPALWPGCESPSGHPPRSASARRHSRSALRRQSAGAAAAPSAPTRLGAPSRPPGPQRGRPSQGDLPLPRRRWRGRRRLGHERHEGSTLLDPPRFSGLRLYADTGLSLCRAGVVPVGDSRESRGYGYRSRRRVRRERLRWCGNRAATDLFRMGTSRKERSRSDLQTTVAENALGKCTERNARDVGTVASVWARLPQERIIVRSILKRDTALSACG